MYRGGRPNRLARVLNRISAIQYSAGLGPRNWVALEVPGRRTGRIISFPLVVANYDRQGYLVAMLGKDTNWVRNVRAADGRAVLRHGRREAVRLEEVDVSARAPILRRYLAIAPGARATSRSTGEPRSRSSIGSPRNPGLSHHARAVGQA